MNRWIASYRLQLSQDFGFADVIRHHPYFHRLGVSHLYLSPIFEAQPGSNHGYDIIDPNRISDERGGEEAFFQLCRQIEKVGLGIILDIVPNHLAACYANPYWRDVLRHGKSSEYADVFDIDWQDDVQEKLVLPVLGKPLAEVLAAGEIQLKKHQGDKVLAYYEQYFPLSPKISRTESSAVEELLDQQNYRLMEWRQAVKKINYRRFFDINGLAAVNAGDEKVFQMLHRKLGEVLAKTSAIHGLRVDHIDGLADPKAYLDRLSNLCRESGRPMKIWVEKILAENEKLPENWACEGTTGYEFSRALDAMTVKATGLQRLNQSFQRLASAADTSDFPTACRQTKRQVLKELFPAELRRLSEAMVHLIGLTSSDSEELVIALISALPVYRTYFTPRDGWSAQDLGVIASSIRQVRETHPRLSETLDVLQRSMLSPDEEWQAWIGDWQRLSGPVMAKGYEDTLLYRYFPLTSLCEVGGQRTDRAIDHFETLLELVESRGPLSMNGTSTHDSKRGEDLRWRLHAISEIPDLYLEKFSEWVATEENSDLDQKVLWFIWQNWLGLVGDRSTSPEERAERLQNYLVKSLRESKLFSHWLRPNEETESKTAAVIRRLCGQEEHQTYRVLLDELDHRGLEISLQCTAMKFLLPGFPDIYQGSEIRNFNLVDPDNRRPVDFAALAEMLDRYHDRSLSEVPPSARKLVLTHRLLKARALRSSL